MDNGEEIDMTQLLKFIIKYLSALFDEYGFVISESKNSGNNFSGASILMASNEMEVFLAIEREEITMYFRSIFDVKKNNWFLSENILALLGHQNCHGVMDDICSSLIRDELPEIIKCFNEAKIKNTINQLKKIERSKTRHKNAKQ